MSQIASALSVDYDILEDVMYIDKGTSQECYGEDGPRGLLFRRSHADDSASGVTILDFDAKWKASKEEIVGAVSQYLGYPESEVESKIVSALALG